MSLDIFALILQSHHQSAKYRPVLENETNISVLLNDFGQLRVNFFAVGALVIKILNNADIALDVAGCGNGRIFQYIFAGKWVSHDTLGKR